MSNEIKRKDDQGILHNLQPQRKIDNVVSVVKDLDHPDRGECALKRKHCTSKFSCFNELVLIFISDSNVAIENINEIKLHYKLNDPSIVKIYDAWTEEQGEWYFILMELCQHNLDDILKTKQLVFNRQRGQQMSKLEYFISWHIVKEVADAVKYLHTQQPKPVVHRDLKPLNVLVNYQPSFIKLCDFDISKEHEGSSSNTAGRGTNIWRAPEVATSGRYNVKIDIYSLAMLALVIFGFDLGKFRTPSYW